MDVRTGNRGRPCFPAGPGDGEKLFDPSSFGRKGQECPPETRTKKSMFVFFVCLFFSDLLGDRKTHKLFQHKLFGPRPKHPILGPRKKVDVPRFLGKDAKKGPT